MAAAIQQAIPKAIVHLLPNERGTGMFVVKVQEHVVWDKHIHKGFPDEASTVAYLTKWISTGGWPEQFPALAPPNTDN